MKILPEEEKVEERWDFRKIVIGLVLVIVFAGVGAYYLQGLAKRENFLGKKTLGVSSKTTKNEDVPPLPSKEDISNIINEAKDTLSQITSDNITSSQSAIQKIISDLKLLEGKKEPADIICQLLCKK